MRCDICSFDSDGSFAPDNEHDLKYFSERGQICLRLESGSDITQAIARGCWICRTIRDSLLPFNRFLPPEWHCEHDLDVLEGCKECSRAEYIRLFFNADPIFGMVIVLGSENEEFCIIGNGIPWPGGLKPPPTSRIEYLSNLARHSRLDQARAWLDRCTLEHSSCQQSTCSPRRLLSIRDTLDNGPSVKLYSPGNSVKKYACLSYCWGLTGNLETLTHNIQSHLRGIHFQVLPKTVQDAVRICLGLQIYYLWVDALCIVQDDENDWASECMRMGDIYSGAHLTLAAIQGHHSEAGLLRVKPFKVARIKVWPPTGSCTEALVHRLLEHSNLNGYYHQQHLKQQPLLTRGWVYQELLLSPRVIRFDVDELSFECREGMMCECGMAPLKHSVARKNLSLVENGLLSHSDAFSLWYEMVEQYSSMVLTRQSDRLPAFSAIASKFLRYGGRYYAGVWQNDFISGLQWYRARADHWGVRCQIPPTLSAPSWSWASQLEAVSYMQPHFGQRSYTAKISINNLVLSNASNILGGVSGGYLDASGILKPINIKPMHNRDARQQPYEVDVLGTDGVIHEHDGAYFDGKLPCELEAKLLSTPNSVWCFLLSKQESCDGDGKSFSLILGLIDEKQCLYQRIGLFEGKYRGRSWFDYDAKEAKILIQ